MENKKPQENTQPKKKRFFTINVILLLLLIFSISLFGLSVYAFMHQDDIKKAIVESNTPKTPTSTTTVTVPLPEELLTPSSKQVLVDRNHSLPTDYVPETLSSPYINSTTDVIQIDQETGDMAKQMISVANEQGISLTVTNGYRSYADQQKYYESRSALLGDTVADKQIEKAGFSEHQTGLAIDFTDDPANSTPTQAFGDTPAGQWLHDHAHEYGFIQRYPKGKEKITGYDYMPWHYRYVGVDIATAIYETNPDCTFEEFYNVQNEHTTH